MAAGNSAAAHGINSEGLKRRGFTPEEIAIIRRAYKTLYRSNLGLDEARQALAATAAADATVGALPRPAAGFPGLGHAWYRPLRSARPATSAWSPARLPATCSPHRCSRHCAGGLEAAGEDRLQMAGIGGPAMASRGFDCWWPSELLAVHGYAAALKVYPKLLAIRRRLSKRLQRLAGAESSSASTRRTSTSAWRPRCAPPASGRCTS